MDEVKNIHWFPGHMKKALHNIESKIKLVDVVIELLDARAPFSSRNEALNFINPNKAHLIVFTKADLADDMMLKKWQNHYKSAQKTIIFADLNNSKDVKNIIDAVIKLGQGSLANLAAKGLKRKTVRALIIGIPNVGKSTLINRMLGKKKVLTENRPGKTRSEQWVRINQDFELLDTPGVLPSSYLDTNKAINLAVLGSIKESILPISELANYLIDFLKSYYVEELKDRYSLSNVFLTNEEILMDIAKNRNFILNGKEDVARAESTLLVDFRNGKIAKVCLDRI